jgi:selenocysteine lyase/cysteine desulfurase
VLEAGVGAIGERVSELAGATLTVLDEAGIPVRTPADPARRAGVVAADHPRASELGAFLADAGVDIGTTPWGLLRIDPHAFCVADDVERLAAGIAAFERRG